MCAAVPQTFVTLDPVAAAAVAKLRHVSDDAPGITRHKAASGFDYRGPDGALIRDIAILGRIKSLAIPPASTGVWIAPLASGLHPGHRPRCQGTQAVSLSPALAADPRRDEVPQDAAIQPRSAADPRSGRRRFAPPRAAARKGAGGDCPAHGADPVPRREYRIFPPQ